MLSSSTPERASPNKNNFGGISVEADASAEQVTGVQRGGLVLQTDEPGRPAGQKIVVALLNQVLIEAAEPLSLQINNLRIQQKNFLMERHISMNYTDVVRQIKTAILQSRYRAAALANRELLSLYYGIGEFVSKNSREGAWGTGAIDQISNQLQQELPGLRGFSAANIKNMRLFYEAWRDIINRQLPTDDLPKADFEYIINRPSVTDDLQIKTDSLADATLLPTPNFALIGFTHHYEIIKKTDLLDERLFYIDKCASEFWSVEKLKYSLKENLFSKQGKLPNNFLTTPLFYPNNRYICDSKY
ncbi:DUF1016 N-terminal domain-containing protein [Proteiniphilum sp. X52]|uniref:DUF1016 N-terminal domain-containing protein n=1 Tax=Proteiniphilum sp. X52 TaxID=2382159 RepID=UPI000F09CF7C|nr:DUF1016 N-terminal domain-containing protein [Proteiniphilum sp. X52]RNC64456.1 DUF1016 family protein [Proteiniphilum sp. X52]